MHLTEQYYFINHILDLRFFGFYLNLLAGIFFVLASVYLLFRYRTDAATRNRRIFTIFVILWGLFDVRWLWIEGGWLATDLRLFRLDPSARSQALLDRFDYGADFFAYLDFVKHNLPPGVNVELVFNNTTEEAMARYYLYPDYLTVRDFDSASAFLFYGTYPDQDAIGKLRLVRSFGENKNIFIKK